MTRKPACPPRKTNGADAIHSALVPLSTKLDHLLADLQLGIRDQRQFDSFEDRAHTIARGLRAAFRGQA